MRILFVLNLRHNKSGITEQILYLKEKLIKESYEVNLVSTFGNIYSRIKGVAKTFSLAAKSDLIIGVGCSYFGFFPLFVAALAAFFLNKRIIYNYHGGQAEKFFYKYNFILKYIFKKDKVIVATEYLKSIFKKYGYNVSVINNFFDFDSFPEAPEEYVRSNKILWARSFEDLYQPELALETAKYLTENYECEFHFYGDGSKYKHFNNKYGSPKIIFHGLIERDALLGEYKNYAILLNTTLNDNFPNTIVEAGYYNLLVISSKVGGISSAYSGEEIKFVEKNDKESFVNAILDAIENKEKYDSMRRNLKKKILNYNWHNIRDKWISNLNDSV